MSAAQAGEFDFEQQLGVTEHRAARGAESIIKRHFERLQYPHRDEINVLRLGWNRAIEKREQPAAVADIHLRHDIAQARIILHGRVFALQAKAPVSVLRLSVLYAIADLLGPEHVQNWAPLWQAIETQNWPAVMQELLQCNWTGLAGSSDGKKALFSQLITALVANASPEGLT